MPNLKDIRRRIGSVKKTRQITSAMKLVAAARMRRSTEAALNARPYRDHLAEVLARVADRAGADVQDPLLERRPEVRRILVVTLTSDKGLCGAFNTNLLRQTKLFLSEHAAKGHEPEVLVYGRKGASFFDFQGIPYRDKTINYGKTPKLDLVRPLCDTLVDDFQAHRVDEVYLAYNRFKNVLSQRPTFQRILPMAVEGSAAEDDALPNFVDYQYEPSPAALLGALLPLYLRTLVYQSFLETEAGELAARMTAMEAATNNATELIGNLTLQYNRARQAAITKEITEIVGGAEAL